MSEVQKRSFTVTKVGGMQPSLFRAWKDYKEGDMVVAEFISTNTKMFQGKETPEHRCKIIEANFKVTTRDGVVDPVGQVLTINSAGQLNKLLEDAKKGDGFTFTYDGKQRSKNPKDTQSYHTFSDLALGDLGSEAEVSTEGL